MTTLLLANERREKETSHAKITTFCNNSGKADVVKAMMMGVKMGLSVINSFKHTMKAFYNIRRGHTPE